MKTQQNALSEKTTTTHFVFCLWRAIFPAPEATCSAGTGFVRHYYREAIFIHI